MLIVSLLGLRSTQQMWNWFLGTSVRTFPRGPFKGRRPTGCGCPSDRLGTWMEWREKDNVRGQASDALPSWLPQWEVPCSICSSPPMNCKRGHPVLPFPLNGFFWVCGQVLGKLASTKETPSSFFLWLALGINLRPLPASSLPLSYMPSFLVLVWLSVISRVSVFLCWLIAQ